MAEEFYNQEYNPAPKILNIPDCLKIYGSFFSEDDLVLHQDITLFDPITLKRLAIPCRSINCLHFQAFDYESYLELNKKKCPCQFLCPICKEGANPTKIYIDSIWLCLLRHYTKSDKIRIGSDGTCSIFSSSKVLDVICIDDSDEEGGMIGYDDQSKPISIAFFLNQKLPKINLDISKQSNITPSMVIFDDLFDCNIDDVLHFVNNCKVEALQIIPSIGEYHAEKIVKARPFICSDFITLRHDLMLKLNRLKLPAAQIMIENLERVVKNKINLIKIRYAEASNKFQVKTNDSQFFEDKDRAASPASANLSKSELKRLKRLRKTAIEDDNDGIFSPLKATKKERKVLKIEGNEVSYPAHSESILPEGDFLLDKRKKNKQPPSDLDQIIQPPKLSKKHKHQLDVSISSTDGISESNTSPRKKSKKSKYIENESAIVASLSQLIAQADPVDTIRKEVDPIASPLLSKQSASSPRTLPKKIYFNIDDDIALPEATKSQGDSSKYQKPLASSELTQPSPLLQSQPPVTGTTVKPKRRKDETISQKDDTVAHSSAPLVQTISDVMEREPTDAITPSLLFDDDDIFGCGFISTTTRSFDEAIGESVGNTAEAPSTNQIETAVTNTKSKKNGRNLRSEHSKQSSGSRKHIRFSDDDSDTTTQTSSSHNEYSDGGPSRYQSSMVASSSSILPPERNHLPLLPVFNASQPQRKSSSTLSLGAKAVSTSSVATNVQNFVPFSPQKQVKPAFQPNISKIATNQPPPIQPQRINKVNSNQQPTSKSILELMISEFATDEY